MQEQRNWWDNPPDRRKCKIMNKSDEQLLYQLKLIAINNLRELAHSAWKSEDVEVQELLNSLALKIEKGRITTEEWNEAIDYLTM